MNATTTLSLSPLLSLSLFSLKTLLSVEGTENNREDVSAARDDACAFLCKQKREKNEVRALKMRKTWREKREKQREKREREVFAFFPLFVVLLFCSTLFTHHFDDGTTQY